MYTHSNIVSLPWAGDGARSRIISTDRFTSKSNFGYFFPNKRFCEDHHCILFFFFITRTNDCAARCIMAEDPAQRSLLSIYAITKRSVLQKRKIKIFRFRSRYNDAIGPCIDRKTDGWLWWGTTVSWLPHGSRFTASAIMSNRPKIMSPTELPVRTICIHKPPNRRRWLVRSQQSFATRSQLTIIIIMIVNDEK
jgi:hypothetical protein